MKTNWPVKKLGELSKIATGKLDANKAEKNGKFPFYTCSDEVLKINQSAFDGESILVAGNGDFWVKYHNNGQFNAYQRTYVIQNKSKEALTKYLFYVVNTKTQDFKRMAQGGIIKFLHLGQLLNLHIFLPDLKIQQKIVERLEAIRKMQELDGKEIKRIEELFISVSNKEFKTKKGWAQYKLGEILSFEYGESLPERKRINGLIPVFGSNGKVGIHNKKLVNGPGIIIGRKGSIGKVTWSDNNYWPIDTTYFIKLIKNYNLKFIFYLLNRLNLNNLNKASGVPGLNRNDVYRIKIFLPSLQEQQKIVEKLEAVQEYKKKLFNQKQLLKELFDSVLDKCMKGEMDN